MAELMSSKRRAPYPSFDSSDPAWLNALVVELWPLVSDALVASSKQLLEHAIRENMPRILPSVKFTTFHLGDEVPVITSVALRLEDEGEGDGRSDGTESLPDSGARTATGRPTKGDGGRAQRRSPDMTVAASSTAPGQRTKDISPSAPTHIVVEMTVEYHGKPHVQMALEYSSTTRFGIDAVDLTGRIEVVISPLISRLPMFAAFQGAFINPPDIDFNLTGLAVAGDMGPWTTKFREVVHDALASIIVLPNRIAFRLDPTVDYVDMAEATRPAGVLRIAVLKGQGFPHTDENALKQTLGYSAQPDVYVVLRLGAESRSTNRVDDSDRPVFHNEVFDFILSTTSPYQTLRIQAYDYDIDSVDDDLGRASVSIRSLLEQPEMVIRLKHSPMGALPSLTVAARLLHVAGDQANVYSAFQAHRGGRFRPKHCSPLMLSVTIDKATNLPTGGKIRPFVRVLLHGKELFRTWTAFDVEGVVYSMDSPSWACSRQALIHGTVDASTQVTFEVRDAARLSGLLESDVLGSAFLLLADLVRCDPCQKTYNFALCHASRARASLRVRVGLDAVLPEHGPPLWEKYCTSVSIAST